MMAPHPGLQIAASPELMSLIFDHLALPAIDQDLGAPNRTWQKYNRHAKALRRSAQACKAFMEPALAVLWRRLDLISSLLRLLPGWDDIGGYGYEEALVIKNEITDEAWARLRWYARFVRVLEQSSWTWIHPYTWTVLAQRCGREPLLPNLETFATLPLSARNPAAMLLISPKLRDLKLVLVHGPHREDTMVARMLIQKITATARGLRTLHIRNDMEAGAPGCLLGFAQLQELRSLTLERMYLSAKDLCFLARFPHLETLSSAVDMGRCTPSFYSFRADDDDSEEDAEKECDAVEDDEGDPEDIEDAAEEEVDDASTNKDNWDPFKPLPLPPGFPALKNLSLVGTAHHLDLVLQSQPPRLTTVSLQIVDGPSFQSLRTALASIFSNLPPTLTSFSLKNTKPFASAPDSSAPAAADDSTPNPSLRLLDLLEPALTRFPHLTHLSLEFAQLPGVCDDDVDRIRPTHVALLLFAAFAPRLRTLVLPELERERGEDFRAPLRVPVARHPLRTLAFDLVKDDYAGMRVHELAILVDLLFPDLELNMERDRPPEREPGRYYSIFDRPPRVSAWYSVRRYIHAVRVGRERGESLGCGRQGGESGVARCDGFEV
ncbi:hypothetical protein OH77DRAFT_1447291 [Trametes cingulata]|nr:hypothetical protein OH77DRAFT_1447291 [Trametes cingulata]